MIIGQNLETGGQVYITEKQREVHMQVIGTSRTGKSKFLEYMIRQDIKKNTGLCLIDPHGTLFTEIVKYLQAIRFPAEKVIIFDPSNDDYITGYNPLKNKSDRDIIYYTGSMFDACAHVWGDEDTNRTPLLKRILTLIFYTLIENNLTLLESRYLTDFTEESVRKYLVNNITDEMIRKEWNNLNSANTYKQYRDEVSSSINRLQNFVYGARLRNIIGQTKNVIDFRTIMDDGYILLVNLGKQAKINDSDANTLGALIINDIFESVFERKKRKRPFYLYIDEAATLVGESIARMLDEASKFGLRVILAHHTLEQLREKGERLYASVRSNCKNKVVFGGSNSDDAEVLVRDMYLGKLQLDKPVENLDKMVVVGYAKEWLRSRAIGSSTGSNQAQSDASSHTSGASLRIGANIMQLGENINVAYTSSTSDGYSASATHGRSQTDSMIFGETETYVPILEKAHTATYDLQKLIWMAMDTIVNQPQQQAVIKTFGHFPKTVKTPFVKEMPHTSERTIPRYIEKCNKISPYTRPAAEVRQEIELRQAKLITDMREAARIRIDEPVRTRQTTRPKIGVKSKK